MRLVTFLLRVLGLALSALSIGALVAMGTFYAVFYLPVILGASSESMIGWGWLTTLPAMGFAPLAGAGVLALLVRKFHAWRLFSLPSQDIGAGRWILATAFSAIPVVLAALVVFPPTREYGVYLVEGHRSRWTEDVRLDDESITTVERFVQKKSYEIDVRVSEISFSGTLAHLPVWNVPLKALLLYKNPLAHQWTIVATASCDVIQSRGQPRLRFVAGSPPTSYFEFRAKGDQWVQVPLSRQSMGRPANLFLGYETNKSRHVTNAVKESHLETVEWKPYLSIREDAGEIQKCSSTSYTRAIHGAEDEILESMLRLGATAEEQQKVEELLVNTRLAYINSPPRDWKADSDPATIQVVSNVVGSNGVPEVSEDGQVIYPGSGRGFKNDEEWQMRQSYTSRLRSIGIERFRTRVVPYEP